jgi:hypothetical protein
VNAAPVYTRRKTIRVGNEHLSPLWLRKDARNRRAANRAANRCINASPTGRVSRYGVVHGKPNAKSGKCDRCDAIAALSR